MHTNQTDRNTADIIQTDRLNAYRPIVTRIKFWFLGHLTR